MSSEKKFCLVVMSNPYPRICVAELGADGRPLSHVTNKWTGKWGKDGEPVYKGTKTTVQCWDAHSSGGTFDSPSVGLIDATPRTYAEAEAIAIRCPKSINDYSLLSHGTAVAAIQRAIAEL